MDISSSTFNHAHEGGTSDRPNPEGAAHAACPVLTEFTHQLKSELPEQECAERVAHSESSLSIAWARLAMLMDYVVRVCLPEVFRMCGRPDTATYLANLPEFGLGTQLSLYYRALTRCLSGAQNRYLQPCLEKMSQFVTILRKEAVAKPVPSEAVEGLCYFVSLRGCARDIRNLMLRLTNGQATAAFA